jgi:hypothetical protein
MDKFDATSPYGRPLLPPGGKNMQPIGDLTSAERATIASTNYALIAAIVIVAVIAIAAVIMALIFFLGFTVRYVDGVGPTNGKIYFVAGSSMSIIPDAATNTITFDNTGVGSIVGGPGITATTESGVTTVSSTLTEQSQLTESDPNGPQVAYTITMPGVPQNTWRVTTSGAFPGTFVPGIVAGDGGQGNVGGTAWTAPAVGEYIFNAYCSVVPSAYIPNDYMSASMAISLGATTVDPTTGVIPPGGRSSLDLSVGTNGAAGPAVPSALTASSTVHVCPTCLVTVGKSVLLHTRIDHNGPAGPPLGTTSTYGIIGGSTITTVGATTVNGNLALSPGASVTGPFVITGTSNIDNAAAVQAQTDLVTLYNSLAAMPCNTVLQGTNLAPLTLGPGVYCFTSSAAMATGTLTLNAGGNPSAQFIFQIGTTLTTAASAVVVLTNGAQAGNVFWQIGTSATFGAANTFLGTVVALTSISVGTTGTYDALFAHNGVVTFAGTSAVEATPAPVTTVTASFTCHLQVSREK